eukprot:gene36305-34361_t
MREKADSALAALERTAGTQYAVDWIGRLTVQMTRQSRYLMWYMKKWAGKRSKLETETLEFSIVDLPDDGPGASPAPPAVPARCPFPPHVSEDNGDELVECAFPTHNRPAPPRRLPELATKYSKDE